MLQITVPEQELFNEETGEFTYTKPHTLQLEHSLISVSKWEMKWKKSYLNTKNQTPEETIDYIRCMTITQNVDPMVYQCLSAENIKEISEYINDPMTATTISNKSKGSGNSKIITSEIIYYDMISLGIPFECQKWHLNRLLTLISVCASKNQPPKKMSKSELLSRNHALNEARKKRLNTHG